MCKTGSHIGVKADDIGKRRLAAQGRVLVDPDRLYLGRGAAAIRQGDLVARSGGDEFLLILPRTNLEAACAIAERVRSGIELTRFVHRRDLAPVRLTASIGVAVALDAHTDRSDLIDRADELLYVAKESGRNRVAA